MGLQTCCVFDTPDTLTAVGNVPVGHPIDKSLSNSPHMERGGRASVTAAAGCTAGAAGAASAADGSEAEGEEGNGVEDHVVSALLARALTRAPPRGDVVPFFRDAFRRSSRTISSPVVLGSQYSSPCLRLLPVRHQVFVRERTDARLAES